MEGWRKVPGRDRAGWMAAALVVVLVVGYGGYVQHWAWMGINGTTATLWDWLKLLMLPVVIALLPVLMRRDARVDPRIRWAGAAGLAVFALLVLLGYVVPWPWTGFPGNHLWEWLNLIALPVAVALLPAYPQLRRTWNRRYTRIALAGLAVFAVIVVGGYVGDWEWTGFTGNTLWNWLQLGLLPLLIPIVVVPLLALRATEHATTLDDGPRGAGADAARPPAPSSQSTPRSSPPPADT